MSVTSNNNTVINNGTISGTLSANAVTITGNNNTLQLGANYHFSGEVVSSGAGNKFVLGGDTNASLDVSQISATGQFRGFSVYQKIANSIWTLNNTASQALNWDILGGTLQLTQANALNGGTVSLSGGNLSLGTGVFSGGVILNQNAGTIDIATGTATFSGNITGVGDLTKTGAGTLSLASANSYTGSTTVNEGTLQFDTDDSMSLYINLCNCLILICSIQHQKQVLL